jgi:predicted nuclease with TOPRIM domain
VAAKDPESRFRAADRRLRALLFGDGLYSAGIARGEENRAQVSRQLRLLREAFDELVSVSGAERGELEQAESRIADLEEDLRRLAAERSRRVPRRKAS